MAASDSAARLMPVARVETWSRTLASTEGRDKIFRLAQYACKLIRGFETGVSGNPVTALGKRIAALETSLATSRQLWRLFKWTNVWAKQYKTSGDGNLVLDILAALSDLGLFLYYLFDNITFIHKVGLIKGNVGNASQRAGRFWLLSTVASFVATSYKLAVLEKKIRELKRSMAESKDENSVREAHQALAQAQSRRLILLGLGAKSLTDTVIATNISGSKSIHPSIIGSCGIVSSAVGCYQVWPRYEHTG